MNLGACRAKCWTMCIEATKSDTPEIVDKLYCGIVHAYKLYIVALTFESMEATEQYFPFVLFNYQDI